MTDLKGNTAFREITMPDDAMQIAHEAKDLASEVMQSFHSEQRQTDLRFTHMAESQQEIKRLIEETDTKIDTNTTALYIKIDALNNKIDDLSTKYDAKFWALALIVIAGLLGGLITLFAKGH